MKFTLGWLKEHLKTEASLDEIVETLTMVGLEVEEVVDRAKDLKPFVVGHVTSVTAHPNADRLQLCTVDTGSGQFEVVCGAPNARSGIKGVFAPIGTYIPGGGFTLEERTIRGVTGHGMLCSERELGLSENNDSIIELDTETKVGEPFTSVSGLEDPVIDVAITPNRGDCLGVFGIARDLAACGLGCLITSDLVPLPGSFKSPINVELRFDKNSTEACPLFVGRMIRGLVNRTSPPWLQQRLVAVGLRPISALVDITNLITIDRARPLHVFDADKLKGNVHARLAKSGESIEALNEQTYQLDSQMNVICDDLGPVALGGIIGGAATACTNETVNVFLEAALFDPMRTARTGRKLNIESDARYRFERGVDWAGAMPGVEFATKLILDLCGGQASDVVSAGDAPVVAGKINFRPARIQTLGGLEVAPDDCAEILGNLGFSFTCEGDTWAVASPSWRNDIDGEADLVEEVLRIKGYDSIPPVSVSRAGSIKPALSQLQRRVRQTRRLLATRGLDECVTWSFLSADKAKMFGGGRDELKLDNPITEEHSDMRPSLLPNLLTASARNAARGVSDLGFCEVGPQFKDDTPKGQQCVASGVRMGHFVPRDWIATERMVDAFDAKADALAVAVALGVPRTRISVTKDAPSWYHPGRSGILRLGPKHALGCFGELHPSILSSFDLAAPIVGFEVFLENIPLSKVKASKARPAPDNSVLPAVARDFAFLVPDEVTAEVLLWAVQSLSGKDTTKVLFTGTTLFDIYVGDEVPKGMKSMAFSVTMQPFNTTLTEDDIQRISQAIISKVMKSTGGELRG